MTPPHSTPSVSRELVGPTLTRTASIAFALLLVGVVAGCRDAPGGPLGVMLGPETEGALSLSMDLPSFTGLALYGGPDLEGFEEERVASWISRWEASWLMEPLAGHQERTEVYDDAVEPLARGIDCSETEDVLRSVRDAYGLVDEPTLRRLPFFYRVRVEEARKLVEWGEEALADGETGEALRAGLEAADRMRTVNPMNVATELLGRAAVARQAMEVSTTGSGQSDERRVDRLIRGAEAALEEGDYHRAILRAYYACRILGVRLL